MPTALILVIDDDADLRSLYSELLEAESYQVLQASSADEGLELLLKYSAVHLILLDLTLPGMDLGEFVARKADVPAHANTPILTISGRDNIASRSSELGAVAYLKKPFNLDDLILKVSHHVSTAI